MLLPVVDLDEDILVPPDVFRTEEMLAPGVAFCGEVAGESAEILFSTIQDPLIRTMTIPAGSHGRRDDQGCRLRRGWCNRRMRGQDHRHAHRA